MYKTKKGKFLSSSSLLSEPFSAFVYLRTLPSVFILHKEIAVGVFNGFWREFNTNVGGLDGGNIWDDVTF